VQVEEDEVGHVLARELDAELALERRHRAPAGAREEDGLDEAQVARLSST
jgi:hypothetical protein